MTWSISWLLTGPGVHMLFLSFYIFRHFTVLYLMYGVIINVSERFNNQHKSKPTWRQPDVEPAETSNATLPRINCVRPDRRTTSRPTAFSSKSDNEHFYKLTGEIQWLSLTKCPEQLPAPTSVSGHETGKSWHLDERVFYVLFCVCGCCLAK